jgi:hypothetical protein
MIKLPATQYIYRHFKGNLYVVVGEAQHTETLEKLVLYQEVPEASENFVPHLWARPYDMFYKDQVDDPERPGTLTLRFRRVGYMKDGKPEFFIGTHDSINPFKPLM